jgi:hypothetical protein
MENLILETVKNYVIVGFVISIVGDFLIRTINVSPSFTIKDILAVTLAWPFVVGTLLSDYINGDF